ncbi:unnamed protein product [Tilletia controversa]|nr:unnamed protein product [Tilletia controversa]CAD6966753.1 unnamed protein product [Tilletia controversa]CAD6983214.1 unnamed protein product [Tilletia controversa]
MSYAYTHYCDPSIPPRTESNKTPSHHSPDPYSPNDTLLGLNIEIKTEDADADLPDANAAPPIPPAVQNAIDQSFYYVFTSFSDMDPGARAAYFSFMRPFLAPEISALIAEELSAVRAENDQLTLANERLDRMFRARLRLSGIHFRFLPESEWSRPWTRHSLRRLGREQGRSMAAQLVVAADGNVHHPFLLKNPAYRYCLKKFGGHH